MGKKHKASPYGYSIILLSALLFGTYGVWSRLMGDSFGPFYQTWVRSLLIILVMLPFMLVGKSFRKIAREDYPKLSLYVVFCVCTQVPLYYAFNHAPIATVQLIFYSLFIMTAYVVGRVYLGEHITKIKLASMLLAFIGLGVVFGVSIITLAPLGLALAAFNGVASGGEVASSKKLSNNYSPALLVFWGWVCTFIIHLVISLLLGEPQYVPQFNAAWLWLFVYAIVNAAAFWLVITGFRHVDASIGSLIGLMEVVFAVLFGALVFHESLTWSVLVGGCLIIIAAMLPDLLNVITHKKTGEAVEPIREL
jgi:drug/metabolite transporter (DMT)-like permease